MVLERPPVVAVVGPDPRTIAAIRSAGAKVAVVADRAVPDEVLGALDAGATGYLLTDSPFEELLAALQAVAAGDTVLHPRAAAAIRSRTSRPGLADLSPRQLEIVGLVAQGLQNKQIARRLGIGVETVKTHLARIAHKMGVSSRTEIVAVAVRYGLVA